jgi:hypothetical protein
MAEATTIPETTATEPAAPQTPASTPEPAKLSFDERIRTDPDFALQTVKNFQTKLNQANARLKPLEPLEGIARSTFGDVGAGVNQIIRLADTHYKIESNPTWKSAVDELISGKRANGTPTNADEYLTPEEKKVQLLEAELRELKQHVVQNETRVSRAEVQKHLESVFDSPLGKAMTAEEREGAFDAIGQQLDAWSRDAAGQRTLATLTPQSIRLVVLNHLEQTGQLDAVYERKALAGKQRVTAAATDSPSLSSRRTEEDTPALKSRGKGAAAVALEALQLAKAKFISAEDRQRLGWQ